MSATTGSDAGGKKSLTFMEQVKSFSRHFWVANLMEMLERLSYFGVRAVVGIYIVDAAAKGGLELSHTMRGGIFFVWALIQSLLPMFTGAFSDRYGYKKSLYLAFTINIIAYIIMGASSSAGMFILGVVLLASGTAIFKPPLHGTLAHTVSDENSSVGWGFFYQLVNIGGFLGPFIAGQMRAISWDYVFYAAAVIIALNFLPTIFLLKDFSEESRKQKAASGEAEKGPFATFSDGILTLVKDVKFVVFLLIFSGFWLMFMQLFDTFPIYIQEWVDSRHLMAGLSKLSWLGIHADEFGNVPPEYMVNMDAGAIVLLMPIIAFITGKFKHISAMIVGMIISTAALVFTGTMISGGWVLFGIFMFAIGEMACSPKFSEYIGLMAPPEKKAIYMGYSNIPFAIGWSLAGLLSGVTYGVYSDKYMLARRYMVEELGLNNGVIESLAKVDVMPMLADKLGIDQFEATKMLFDMYNPWITWVIFGAVGVAATIGMIIYHIVLERSKKNAA